MSRRVALTTLLDELERTPSRQATTLIGLDGRGGSGKTTLARALASLSPSVTVVSIDDFYVPWGKRSPPADQVESATADTDAERLHLQVLEPSRADEPGRYQRWNWDAEVLAEWHEVPVGGLVIVEGVAVCRREWRAGRDLSIRVDCPESERLARGLARDGQGAEDNWARWLPAGDRYEREHAPREQVDLVLDGSSQPGLDPTRECVRLR